MSPLPAPYGFAAARRGAVLARVRHAIAGRGADYTALITLDDALAALGEDGVVGIRRAEVPVESIVGTLMRSDDFDREFRPRTARVRQRWQAVAGAVASGASLPPVELTRLGEMHFVRDGHHRIAVARALGRPTVEANVLRLCTVAFAMCCLRLMHLPSKAAERLFLERVPLPNEVRGQLWLDDPADWMRLTDAAEAWGFRNGMNAGSGRQLREFAEAWWSAEVLPAVTRNPGVHRQRDVQSYLALLEHRAHNPGMV